MRVLLLSTYELGRQPVHLASPKAGLEADGHEVEAVDLAVDELDRVCIDRAEAVAISVPMHTATRLAESVVSQIRRLRPELPISLYGLYAGVASDRIRGEVTALLAGEYEPALRRWVSGLERGSDMVEGHVGYTGRSEFIVPDRSSLATLERYARLEHQGEALLAGAVEASHGCRHRCRHCPIPPVYDGRIRIVPRDVVLADIDQLVAHGARHVSFGDPDFLNAPAHTVRVLEEAHQAYPDLTFDVTVKVEHIIGHSEIWPRLAEANLLFVVSAFESVDETTLEILDKGHSVDDMVEAMGVVRSAGIHIRPTWLPFVPWTESDHIVSLFRFLDSNDLLGSTDPVQLAIKLLIPRGSLLENHPAVVPHLEGYDSDSLTWRWRFVHDEVELMHKDLEAIAASASDCGQDATKTLDDMRKTVSRATGVELRGLVRDTPPTPRLTESWFCCAEPTASQSVTIGLGPG